MERIPLPALVLISALLSFPLLGPGRMTQAMRHRQLRNTLVVSSNQTKDSIRKGMMRRMVEFDYSEPRANTNPRNGGLFNPSPPSS